MAILLSKGSLPESKNILILGSNIELSSLYVRVTFICNYDGSLTCNYKTYIDYDAFLNNSEILTNVINTTYNFVILSTESQSLETALIYMNNAFIELGYNSIILSY